MPAPDAAGTIDYGESDIFAESDIDAAIEVIMGEFGSWDDCVMQGFAYAGDDACGADEAAYVNEMREATEPDAEEFGQAIVIVTDFHTPVEVEGDLVAFEPDADYEGWTWHLGHRKPTTSGTS